MLVSRVLAILFSGVFVCVGAFCTGCSQTNSSSENSVPKYEIKQEVQQFPSELSSSEKELAAAMGYDAKALEAVKKFSGSTFSKIDLNDPYQDEPTRIYNGTWNNSEQRLKHFKELAVRYPELKPCVDPIIANLSTQTKNGAEQAKQFDGKPLDEQVKEKPALRFYIPVPAEIRALCKTGRREPPIEFFSDDSTAEIKALQAALKPLGYTAYATRTYRGQPFFNTAAEANAFVKSINPLEFAVICHDPTSSRELDFDPAKSDPKKFDYGFFFVNIEKIGPNKWRSTMPEHPIVHTLLKTAVLTKMPSNTADAKFQPVISEGTNGINYDIDNNKVLERLKTWDRLYGINILSASSDSVGVEFSKLPDNLDAFSTELWKFCPDLMDADPEANDAETKKLKQEFINELRQTKLVHLWWD